MGLFGRSKKELIQWQNKIIANPSKKLLMNEKELQYQTEIIAENHLRIVKESSQLCDSTINPDVFFQRYDLLIKHSQKLVELSDYVKFKGASPKVALKHIKEQRVVAVQEFMDRCFKEIESLKTDAAKAKRYQKLLTDLIPYKNQIEEVNWSYLEGICVRNINSFIESGKAKKTARAFSLIKELNKYVIQGQEYIHSDFNLIINPYYTIPKKTDFINQPLTESGRKPKYPVCFHYETPDNENWQFGDAWLLPDGSIGKARLITWIEHNGFQIHLAIINDSLNIKKIEYTNRTDMNCRWKVLFKV